MCPLNVFTFDIMKVTICQFVSCLIVQMNRLEVMECSSVRESVKYFMNDKRQDPGTTTYGVMNEV